jgi:hypothetical protein
MALVEERDQMAEHPRADESCGTRDQMAERL